MATNRQQVAMALIAIALGSIVNPIALCAQDTLSRRILELSEADQISWISATLDQGLPSDRGSALNTLIATKSSLTLPMLEGKIEQVLRSASPLDCFTDKSVDPERFIHLLAVTIAEAGNEAALKSIARLMKIDEKRFGYLVNNVLVEAAVRRNPFELVYRGLEAGDPAVDRRIVTWLESRLSDKAQSNRVETKKLWAEALVERYGRMPVQTELDNDNLFSRMKPGTVDSFRADLYSYAVEAWEKHPRRMMALSESEQIAFTKSYLDRGLPPEQREAMGALLRGRSSLILPLIEKSVENLLKSSRPSPEEIAGMSSPAGKSVMRAIYAITEAGNEQALQESAKLLKLDKELFSGMVPQTLDVANTRGNPFLLAYRALDTGDAQLTKEIIAWAERRLSEQVLDLPKSMARQWAEAMLLRYRSAPDEIPWSRDPIVSRLKPTQAEGLHNYVHKFAIGAAARQAGK